MLSSALASAALSSSATALTGTLNVPKGSLTALTSTLNVPMGSLTALTGILNVPKDSLTALTGSLNVLMSDLKALRGSLAASWGSWTALTGSLAASWGSLTALMGSLVALTGSMMVRAAEHFGDVAGDDAFFVLAAGASHLLPARETNYCLVTENYTFSRKLSSLTLAQANRDSNDKTVA